MSDWPEQVRAELHTWKGLRVRAVSRLVTQRVWA